MGATPRCTGGAVTLADRLLAVVAADDAIVQTKRLRDTGRMHYTRSAWRGLYAARERADRELWGTHADDRAQVARAILAALDAERAQGYARAMGEVVAEVQARTEGAVSSYYADRSSYREGYSDACDTLCELVQHMAQTRRD